jgi:alpha-mannosidase
MRCFGRIFCGALAAWLAVCPATWASAEQAEILWQIGQADDDTAEFALAPNGYNQYGEDPLFVIGRSEPKQDWPYVQPGPTDSWAGSREHEFVVAFTVTRKPAGGTCRLLVDLVDTHDKAPPRLAVELNGRRLAAVQMPAGGPDDSVLGDPAKGREHKFTVDVPADELVVGINEISLRTLSGSWVLYDWVGFEAPAGTQLGPTTAGTIVRAIESHPVLVERDGKLMQTVQVTVRHFGEPATAMVDLHAGPPVPIELKPGTVRVDIPVPAVEKETTIPVEVTLSPKTIASRQVTLQPVRKWVLYLLPHSHTDIGYTKLQTEVEQDHWRFYEEAIEAARRTADYPPGAQFKWNVEVLWAVDSYLKQAPPEKQQAFIEAVQKGWVGLDALYGNELTALCRPEELVRLVDFAGQIAERCGVTIDSAMITDVPGYTWGLTTVLARAGVKYFSIGPNSGHRIGYTLQAWGDKPFWWITPSGEERILCWIPRTGYYRAITNEAQVLELVRRADEAGYPYDLIQVRYCLGDNAGPGLGLSDLVKGWNAKYAYPKLVIATTSEMMHALERRYGDVIPEARGDFTPYWEDGAGSSALETGLNRNAAERLSQAEAIWAILSPKTYPADEFYAAWRNVVLYDEHTWGAHNSISQPDSDFAQGQWAIKQAFALDADKQSRKLLADAAAPVRSAEERVESFLVFNTSNWPRTDLVIVPKGVRVRGNVVTGPDGNVVPSQRLSNGQFAFLAQDVPPLGACRFSLKSSVGHPVFSLMRPNLDGRMLATNLSLRVDKTTGAIVELKRPNLDANLADAVGDLGLNGYRYVDGRDPSDPKPNGRVTLTVKESGPLVGSLLIESEAPGCRRLSREIRLVYGLDHVDILNVVDKQKVRTPESVHFGFAFNVPEGVMRMNTPLAVVRPEDDQLPGACKNYFTVSRWVDVSNDDFGVTWATIDAPLVEVGAITVDVPNWRDPANWIEHLERSQTLYSYVMNNYWETNYKADQEGPTLFRYALRPHAGPYDPLEAARFGIERSQPLVAVPTAAEGPALVPPRLRVEPDDVIVTAFKPSRDRKAWIVRLFGASGRPARAALAWADPQPKTVWMSDPAERTGEPVAGPIEVPPFGLVTLRAELPE